LIKCDYADPVTIAKIENEVITSETDAREGHDSAIESTGAETRTELETKQSSDTHSQPPEVKSETAGYGVVLDEVKTQEFLKSSPDQERFTPAFPMNTAATSQAAKDVATISIGPSPSYVRTKAGVQLRVANTSDFLIEEMSELDLKNPSDSLLVRLFLISAHSFLEAL
jgi:hypothetical protein